MFHICIIVLELKLPPLLVLLFIRESQLSFEAYLFFYAEENTGRERRPATKLPVNPKFIDQDESCPGFGGQS